MLEDDKSLKLARFHIALDEIRGTIHAEVLPLGSYLQCPDDELLQTLELAAMNIDSYLKAYRLEAVPVRKESK